MEKETNTGGCEQTPADTNLKYKASVFHKLFSDPDILRELYSAVEGVELPKDIPVSINTLSNAIVHGKLNDISFEIDKRLVVLIEHQSTINNNMPFRLLEYVVRVYRQTLDTDRMHQRTLVKIPRPEFIVLYNGKEPYDDYRELRLSDAFMDTAGLAKEGQRLTLELVAKVYNINDGRNPEMLQKSVTLGGYSFFIGKIREYENGGMPLDESLVNAVKYCIDKGIIADFLKRHGAEVIKMLFEESTVEKAYEAYYNEGLEEGRVEGFDEGLEEGIEKGRVEGREERDQYFLSLINQGLSTEEIKQRLEQERR